MVVEGMSRFPKNVSGFCQIYIGLNILYDSPKKLIHFNTQAKPKKIIKIS